MDTILSSKQDSPRLRAAQVTPTEQQYRWMQMPLTIFVHFSLNTFYDTEWGDGTEDPARFNPRRCDPEQWAEVIAASGARLAILTCKHHGGFCLWPSAYTDYSVAATPWKNGQGDLVREFSTACAKRGIEFGVYLSPWDRHEASYGDSEQYNRFFCNQLTELLSNYGKISVVWFDGACRPKAGKVQQYDWERYYRLIRKLQPDCLISGIGPDIRWCGNEAGCSRPAEWAVINLTKSYADFNRENCSLQEIGDPGNGENLVWYPAEVDFSLRPGWFYHPAEDREIKSLRKLVDIYFNSAGHNAVPLLNITPDTEGRIPEGDAQRLRAFGELLKTAFSGNLLEGLPVDGSEPEFPLPPQQTFNCIMLRENIRLGQRIEEYAVEIFREGSWQRITSGLTIGNRELKLFPPVNGERLRVKVLSSRATPCFSQVGVYDFPLPPPDEETGTFDLAYSPGKTKVSEVSSEHPEYPARLLFEDSRDEFSTDPEKKLPQWVTIKLDEPCTVRGLILLPAQRDTARGLPADCSCHVSSDGTKWLPTGTFELANALNNPGYQHRFFEQSFSDIRYLRVTVHSTWNGEPFFRLHRFFAIAT